MITLSRYNPSTGLYSLVDVYHAADANAALDAAWAAFPYNCLSVKYEGDDGVRQDGDKALDARTGDWYDARDGVPV